MAHVRSWVGLDVHARKVVAAVIDGETGELVVRRLSGETAEVVGFCVGLPGPVRVAYEAGPTGFALARALQAAGVGCVIAAPGKIERPAQDRVKTDRRDAERLVRLLMVGGLHAVRVPSVQEAALRDLVRAREDLRGDLMRARHRLGKLLLRYDVQLRRHGAGVDGPPPRVAMSNPVRGPHSILDPRALTTKPGPAVPNPPISA
jgi:transposase